LLCDVFHAQTYDIFENCTLYVLCDMHNRIRQYKQFYKSKYFLIYIDFFFHIRIRNARSPRFVAVYLFFLNTLKKIYYIYYFLQVLNHYWVVYFIGFKFISFGTINENVCLDLLQGSLRILLFLLMIYSCLGMIPTGFVYKSYWKGWGRENYILIS